MKHISILASGAGTNAENIIRYFSNANKAKVTLVLSNKPQAKVMERAAAHGVDSFFFDRAQFYETGEVLMMLQRRETDLLVLAGFLWLVPGQVIEAFRGRIINIHPALLPKYGGKGMFGTHVHQAVKASGDTESGITIHFVDENYDKGEPVVQVRCPVFPEDSPEQIAARVLKLEHFYFPRAIEKLLL